MAHAKSICCINLLFLLLVALVVRLFAPTCIHPLVCTNIWNIPLARDVVEKAHSKLAFAEAIKQSMDNLTSAFNENDAKLRATWQFLQVARYNSTQEKRRAAQDLQNATEASARAENASKAADGFRLQAKHEQALLEEKQRALHIVQGKSANLHDELLSTSARAQEMASLSKDANLKLAGSTKRLATVRGELEYAEASVNSLRNQSRLKAFKVKKALLQAELHRRMAAEARTKLNQIKVKRNATARDKKQRQDYVRLQETDLKAAEEEMSILRGQLLSASQNADEFKNLVKENQQKVEQDKTTVKDSKQWLEQIQNNLDRIDASIQHIHTQIKVHDQEAAIALSSAVAANRSLQTIQYSLTKASEHLNASRTMNKYWLSEVEKDRDLDNRRRQSANLSQQRLAESRIAYEHEIRLYREALNEETASKMKLANTSAEVQRHQAVVDIATSTYNATMADRLLALAAQNSAEQHIRRARSDIVTMVAACLALQSDISEVINKTSRKKNSHQALRRPHLESTSQLFNAIARLQVPSFLLAEGDLEENFQRCKRAKVAEWAKASERFFDDTQQALRHSEWVESSMHNMNLVAYALVNAAIFDVICATALFTLYSLYRCVAGAGRLLYRCVFGLGALLHRCFFGVQRPKPNPLKVHLLPRPPVETKEAESQTKAETKEVYHDIYTPQRTPELSSRNVFGDSQEPKADCEDAKRNRQQLLNVARSLASRMENVEHVAVQDAREPRIDHRRIVGSAYDGVSMQWKFQERLGRRKQFEHEGEYAEAAWQRLHDAHQEHKVQRQVVGSAYDGDSMPLKCQERLARREQFEHGVSVTPSRSIMPKVHELEDIDRTPARCSYMGADETASFEQSPVRAKLFRMDTSRSSYMGADGTSSFEDSFSKIEQSPDRAKIFRMDTSRSSYMAADGTSSFEDNFLKFEQSPDRAKISRMDTARSSYLGADGLSSFEDSFSKFEQSPDRALRFRIDTDVQANVHLGENATHSEKIEYFESRSSASSSFSRHPSFRNRNSSKSPDGDDVTVNPDSVEVSGRPLPITQDDLHHRLRPFQGLDPIAEPLSHRSMTTNATSSTEGAAGKKVNKRKVTGPFWKTQDMAQIYSPR